MLRRFLFSFPTATLVLILNLAPLQAQDVLTVGTVSGATAGEVAVVPLRLLDRSGTALDTGAESHRTIHSLSVTVEYAPAAAVSSVTFVRGGVTGGLTPRFETQVAGNARRSWIVSFDEPVPLTGGNQIVGQVRVQVASGVAPGTEIELELVAGTTALSNASGTILETQANGGLGLVDGSIEVTEAGCTTDTTLCLLADRFQVEIAWVDFQGKQGVGHAVQLTDDGGYFWFFSDANVEVVIKALDGQGINGHFWIFYGALSNVEYEITVTDSVTGQSKEYFNPARNFASVGDTRAFPGDPSPGTRSRGTAAVGAAVSALAPTAGAGTQAGILVVPTTSSTGPGNCIAADTVLCLLDDRFQLEMNWTDFQGDTGIGHAVPLTDETGYFWFFTADNVEIVVKTLDGTSLNGHFWVFYGALSNVEFTLQVTDTVTGAEGSYTNPSGTFASVGDTRAFAAP